MRNFCQRAIVALVSAEILEARVCNGPQGVTGQSAHVCVCVRVCEAFGRTQRARKIRRLPVKWTWKNMHAIHTTHTWIYSYVCVCKISLHQLLLLLLFSLYSFSFAGSYKTFPTWTLISTETSTWADMICLSLYLPPRPEQSPLHSPSDWNNRDSSVTAYIHTYYA